MADSAQPVAGIDGCRGGWVVVEHHPNQPDPAHRFPAVMVTDLAPIIERLRNGDLAAVAIDMPIGLLDTQPRSCDLQARAILGPRRSSVFPAPVRDALDARDYTEACDKSRACSGKALSIQAFNLLPKIAQLDRLVRPGDQDRLVEAHPECAFARLACAGLAGAGLAEPKRTPDGQKRRINLLTDWDPALGAGISNAVGLPILDLIDAAALVVTARHVASGTEHRLGSDTDRLGLLAQIVY